MNATISGIVSVALGVVGLVEAEAARVLEVPLGRLRGALGARARRRLVDLVVHVRDVVDERHLVPARAQPARAATADHVRARVADVGARIDGRAADVHPDRPGRLGQLACPRARCHRAASTLRSASSRGSAATTAQSSGPRSRRSARAAAPAGRRRPPSARARAPSPSSAVRAAARGSARASAAPPRERLTGSGSRTAARNRARLARSRAPRSARRELDGAPARAASSSSGSARSPRSRAAGCAAGRGGRRARGRPSSSR